MRESITQEAQQSVRRLRHHPSIVLWAGNNEDYQIREDNNLEYIFEDMNVDGWLESPFPARYYYEHLLPKIVAEESPNAIYWPGSPFSGSKLSSDLTVGDVHQWNGKHVWKKRTGAQADLGCEQCGMALRRNTSGTIRLEAVSTASLVSLPFLTSTLSGAS